jgi:splicing factor 3B subunit 2
MTIDKAKTNRYLKKKLRKQNKKNKASAPAADEKKEPETPDVIEVHEQKDADKSDGPSDEPIVEVEWVASVDQNTESDPLFKQYAKIFEKFRTGDLSHCEDESREEPVDHWKKLVERKKPAEMDLKDDDDKDESGQKLSKRKAKLMSRMSVADLKTLVRHPELVEMHDVTARDPLTLVLLKSTRNTVPVPRHWCFKRKYLQGKRGFEKPPFELPEFIRRTGIMEMREAVLEKDDSKSLKTKMREKMRPKMGKIDIDYQKLHDAFFKWQTKPKMTIHGDLYFEGKEFETVLKDKKPGELSAELRQALGMPVGPNAHKVPPPWLIAMQRYGPPPSYPSQRIPGLNAPIPDGTSFGYHAGGWGKPPVDEYGRPLYGDVFGLSGGKDSFQAEEVIDKGLWGEMEPESEDEEESEAEEEDEEESESTAGTAARADDSGLQTPASGLATPGGMASIPPGLETPGLIELRKRKIEEEMEMRDNPALFTVLPEKRTDKLGQSMMGSTHVYEVSGAGPSKKRREGDGVDVALDPSELEMDQQELRPLLEQKIQDTRSHLTKDPELGDMLSRHLQDSKKKSSKTDDAKKKKFKF